MGDREEIKKRVEAFKAHQDRLTREREARMDKLTQQIRRTLSEMYERSTPASTPKH